MNDIIFISLENWDEMWRRNQFLCAELARRHLESRILFVGLSRNLGQLLKAGRIGTLFKNVTCVLKEFPNITVTRPLRVGIERYEWGLQLNEWLYHRHVSSRTRGFSRPILWINGHHAHYLASRLHPSRVIYDITDDWTTSSQSELDRRRTIDADRILCARADEVIVCSQRLYKLKERMVQRGRLHLVANGVDADHYARVGDRALPIAPELEGIPHPIFGYTGTLHPDRLDVDMVESLARRISTGTSVLVGPSCLGEAAVRRLQETGRVKLLPAVKYRRVPEFMRAFDVCIVPHVVTDFTESLNPIKLWEYLAAGKPIVSTPVAGFRDYPTLVHIASGVEAFANALSDALEESPMIAEARRDEARKHSWKLRVDAVESILGNSTMERSRSSHKGKNPCSSDGVNV
jgi:glycosyltransferase involved in cell wall biosynthesis